MIKEIETMGFGREQALKALKAAFFNPERAIEYLLTGIPENPEPQPQTQPSSGGQSGG